MKARTASILFALSVFATNMEAASPDDAIISHIPRDRVQSSALAKVGYSKRLHLLEIEFDTPVNSKVPAIVRSRDGYCFGLEFITPLPA